MEAKDKAEELVKKYSQVRNSIGYKVDGFPTVNTGNLTKHSAIEFAIISVDETIQLLIILERNTSFYEEVKSELEKMKG